MSIVDDASGMAGDLVELRRRLHREPEVGLDLPRTQEKVLDALDGTGLELREGSGCSSVTPVLRGSAPAARRGTVLLRADMDALPVRERTGLDYAATNGSMHACGHDLHTAMLTGAAHLLSRHRDRLAGDVVFTWRDEWIFGWFAESPIVHVEHRTGELRRRAER